MFVCRKKEIERKRDGESVFMCSEIERECVCSEIERVCLCVVR